MKNKIYKAGKGKGGLHVGSKKPQTLSVGSAPSAKSMASKGSSIILGGNNRGTSKLDASTR